MAPKTQKTAAPKTEATPASTALVRKAPADMEPWEAELYADAQKATEQEAGVGGGNFISTQGGVLKVNDQIVPGNEIAVCVLDSVTVKTFFAKKFKPGQSDAPACYAFSRDENLAPHEAVTKPCATTCLECPNNAFGTADGGERAGKACADRRRLAVIPVGTMVGGTFHPTTQVEALKKAEMSFFTCPPTALKAWAGYVKGLKASVQRPPYAVFTSIKLVPHPTNQFAVEFTMLAPATKDQVPVLVERHREAEEKIIFPFPSATPAAGEAAAPAGKQPRNKFAK